MIRRRAVLLALLSIAVLAAPAAAAPGDDVKLSPVATVVAPTEIKSPPQDPRRLFVVEQQGKVRLVRDGRLLRLPFLDITDLVQAGGERGLLSLEFAPDYARSRRFYVYYTDKDGDVRVDEFRRSSRNANRAVRGSRRRVLFQEHSQFGNHNGGQLHFGPDGLLYASIGDGGGGGDPLGAGQRLNTLLGKIVRIDPRRPPGETRARYRVPAGNPFVGREGARPEIYAYGLRNPFRFSFDRSTGDLTVGDVGQGAAEEVSFARRGQGRGANFGWNCFEGRQRFSDCEAPGHVPPVIERLRSTGSCSAIGGYVVRDPSLGSLTGRYLHSDLCAGTIRSAALALPTAEDSATRLTVASPSTFGEDACGRLYVASIETGQIFRLVGPQARSCTRARISAP